MGGHRGHAARLQVALEQALDLLDALAVKGGEGLVENPQFCAGYQQARQRQAALLSGRQVARRGDSIVLDPIKEIDGLLCPRSALHVHFVAEAQAQQHGSLGVEQTLRIP